MFEAQSVIIKHSNNTQPIYQFIISYPIYQSTPEKVRKQIIWTFIAAFVLGRSLVQLAFVVCYFFPCCSSMIWMKPNLRFYCIVYIITFWGVYADLFSSTHPSHKDTWICLLIHCMAKWGPNFGKISESWNRRFVSRYIADLLSFFFSGMCTSPLEQVRYIAYNKRQQNCRSYIIAYSFLYFVELASS